MGLVVVGVVCASAITAAAAAAPGTGPVGGLLLLLGGCCGVAKSAVMPAVRLWRGVVSRVGATLDIAALACGRRTGVTVLALVPAPPPPAAAAAVPPSNAASDGFPLLPETAATTAATASAVVATPCRAVLGVLTAAGAFAAVLGVSLMLKRGFLLLLVGC